MLSEAFANLGCPCSDYRVIAGVVIGRASKYVYSNHSLPKQLTFVRERVLNNVPQQGLALCARSKGTSCQNSPESLFNVAPSSFVTFLLDCGRHSALYKQLKARLSSSLRRYCTSQRAASGSNSSAIQNQ